MLAPFHTFDIDPGREWSLQVDLIRSTRRWRTTALLPTRPLLAHSSSAGSLQRDWQPQVRRGLWRVNRQTHRTDERRERLFSPRPHGRPAAGPADPCPEIGGELDAGEGRRRPYQFNCARIVREEQTSPPCASTVSVHFGLVRAYRGEIVLKSGRASRRPDRLDLKPPGGWLPTYGSL